MVSGRVDPTVHEFLPRDRGERLGGGIATAAAGPPDGRANPAAGHEPRASGPRASSPPTRAEDPEHHGSVDGPGAAMAEAPATSPARMRPAIACPMIFPRGAIHDDRRVGGSPPGRTMRDAAHPPHPGRGGGDAPAGPAPARSVPARPRGRQATGPAAATIPRTTPSERPRRRLGPAPRGPGGSRRPVRTRRRTRQRRRPPGPPPAGPSRTRDGSAGRSSRTRMPPPTGARTGRGGRLLRGGCGGVPRSPGPPGGEDRRFLPGTRSPRGPPGAPPSAARSRRAPPRSRHQRRGRGAPPAIPRPGPRPPAPQDRTIRPPRPPARTPGTTPRTTRPLNPAPHPGTDTTQPHLDHFRPPPEKHQTLQFAELLHVDVQHYPGMVVLVTPHGLPGRAVDMRQQVYG